VTWKKKHEFFNCSIYGPPIPVYYSSEFVPTFSLYDGDTYIKEVDVEYVLIEDKGSIAYSYSKKLKDVKKFFNFFFFFFFLLYKYIYNRN